MPEDTALTHSDETQVHAVTHTTEEKTEILCPKEDPDPPPQSMKAGMFHIKCIVLSLNILTFVLSLPIMFTVIYLIYIRQYDCEGLLNLPKLQLGIALALVIVFIVSNLVGYFRSRFPILGILLVMIPLFIMLVVGLGLVGAYKVEARKIPGSPPWLKSRMHDDSGWPRIKTCIYETRTCKDLIARSYLLKSYDCMSSKLSSIEAGCCTPPPVCEMECVNGTYWRRPLNVTDDAPEQYIKDCNMWHNKESILCYNCDTCKEGYLRTLEGKWQRLGAFLIAISLLLMISHLLLFVATKLEQYGG